LLISASPNVSPSDWRRLSDLVPEEFKECVARVKVEAVGVGQMTTRGLAELGDSAKRRIIGAAADLPIDRKTDNCDPAWKILDADRGANCEPIDNLCDENRMGTEAVCAWHIPATMARRKR
jgi:hypothetical protein